MNGDNNNGNYLHPHGFISPFYYYFNGITNYNTIRITPDDQNSVGLIQIFTVSLEDSTKSNKNLTFKFPLYHPLCY